MRALMAATHLRALRDALEELTAGRGSRLSEILHATMHHRRMFVAMSRPRRLLCIAAAAAHVDDATRPELAAQGWIIEDLSAGGGTTEQPAGGTTGAARTGP
jgi:hypothetical protein